MKNKDSKVALRQHSGTMPDGKTVYFDQWLVDLDGSCVGLLPHAPNTRLMPIVNLPESVWQDVVSQCEQLRSPAGKVLPPFPIYFPPDKVDEDESEQQESDD